MLCTTEKTEKTERGCVGVWVLCVLSGAWAVNSTLGERIGLTQVQKSRYHPGRWRLARPGDLKPRLGKYLLNASTVLNLLLLPNHFSHVRLCAIPYTAASHRDLIKRML